MTLRATLCTVANAERLRARDIDDIAKELVELLDDGTPLSLFIMLDGRVEICAAGSLTQHMLARDHPSRFVGTYDRDTIRAQIVDDLHCFA
jgi:hypothetical protein